jgi:hypothetical protein
VAGEADRAAKLLLARGALGQLGALRKNLPGPPGAHRVVEEELHHVVLGEELGHGGQLVGADLDTVSLHGVLPLGLPELVGPAERVVGGEDGGRERREELLQRQPGFGRERHLEGGVVRPEDARQHARGGAARVAPGILAAFAREIFALGHRDRDPRLRLDQELVLGQEAGEEHSVPVLVGHLVGEALDFLNVIRGIAPIAELATVRAEPLPKMLLVCRHSRVRPRAVDRERLERPAGAGLGHAAGVLYGAFELLPKIARENRHAASPTARSPGPCGPLR